LPGEVLRSGEALVSANGQFHLAMLPGGNLVHYFDMHQAERSHWATNTDGLGPGCAVLDDAGHIVVMTLDGRITWSSRDEGLPGQQIVVQDDANLVLYRNPGLDPWDGSDSIGWAHNRPLDWIAPGQRLRPGWFMTSHNWNCKLLMAHDGSLLLHGADRQVRWTNEERAGAGAELRFQGDGNVVVYDATGEPRWATGTDARAADFLRLSGDCTAFLTEGDATIWQAPAPGPCDGPGPQVPDRLSRGEVLRSGESLVSANGQFHLAMQDDGNLVHYFDMHDAARSHWASESFGGSGCARINEEGHIVVMTEDGRVTWSTRDGDGRPGQQFVAQDDANLVFYRDGGLDPFAGPESVSWAHNRPLEWIAPGQRLLPGWFMTSSNWRCKLIMQGDGNFVLYDREREPAVWASDTVGHPGAYLDFQRDGNVVVYDQSGPALWATATDRHASDFQRLDARSTAYVTEGPSTLWLEPGLVAPGARGDDYPYRNHSHHDVDPWGFYKRYCTSFVAWRINTTNGVRFLNGMGGNGRFGHARTWDDRARQLGYDVNQRPVPGAIAQTDAGEYGHVAWVAEVRRDTVVIEEYNRRHLAYSVTELPIGAFQYIHLDSTR